MIEIAPDLLKLWISATGTSMELMSLLEELAIPVFLNCKLEEITDTAAICRNIKTSEKIQIPADVVLLALGMSSQYDIANSLRHSAPETEVFIVGDAIASGTIAAAIRSAFKAAVSI
jgi:hypothetical protein